MNWLNGFYLVLSFCVLSTLPKALWGPMALCLLLVGLLWVWRWLTDWHRSKGLSSTLSGSVYCPVMDHVSLAEVLRTMDFPLRDWIMRGYPTGATQYWVRNAWCVKQTNLQFTAMEVQTTPGYIGTGIPLWRVRHSALIVQSTQVWSDFVLWRDPAATFKSNQSGARSEQRRMGRKHQLRPFQGFWIEAKEPDLAWAQFFALWAHMDQPEDADLFAMTQGHNLVMFWRKRPPNAETLEQLLKGCLASTIASGVPFKST